MFQRWLSFEDDDGNPLWGRTPQQPRKNEPLGEIYLELNALDLDDVDAIVEFVRDHGALGMWDIDYGDGYEPRHKYLGFPEVPGFDTVCADLWESRQRITGMDPETISEFRWGAKCLRDMTTSWRIINGEIDHEDAVWVAPCWAETVGPDDYSWYASPYWALGRGMQSGLAPFGPTIHFQFDDDEPPPNMPHAHNRSVQIPLYCYLCLELFRHISEGASYRSCANERCDRMFVRQRGRAEHGQHRRRGVKYCSAECARAQAQRAYRRRKQVSS